ncbi:MAG TPA: EpsI family protein [Novosphingobium sp.]
MDRRGFLIGSAMGAAGLAGVALQPVAADPPVARGTLAGVIPTSIGAYRIVGTQGLVLPAETPLTRHLYSDLLIRLYGDPQGSFVMMLAAAGAATGPGLSVHRPERCYPAAGFEIASVSSVPLSAPAPAGARARLVTAVRAERRELVHYWVRVGQSFPLTTLDQRLALMAENLQGSLPAARLLRLSVLSSGPAGDPAGFARVEAFSRDLLNALSPEGRHLMLGS